MECEQGAAVEMDVGEEFVARCKQQLQQRATPEEQWEGEGEAPVVVAIGVLVDFLSSIRHSVTTVAEVLRLLKAAIQDMVTRSNRNRSSHTNVALESGCEIFNWYITRFTAEPSFERSSLEEIMDEILKYGRQYLQALKASRSKIAAYGKGLIRDNSTILVHSKCSCVLEVIRAAANPSLPSPKHFSVIIVSAATTPAAVDEEEDMVRKVRQLGLPTRLISQAAVGFEMEKVDIVCLGAEAVCLSGGIVNTLGTLTVALCAGAMNKPVYVFAESHKFTKALFPLSNADMHAWWTAGAAAIEPDDQGSKTSQGTDSNNQIPEQQERSGKYNPDYSPTVDYTEPNLITYVVSDLGILTPAIVCEQLLRLYE